MLHFSADPKHNTPHLADSFCRELTVPLGADAANVTGDYQRRVEDTALYYHELRQAGVNVPHSSIRLQLESDRLTVRVDSEYIPQPRHCLLMAAEADARLMVRIMAGVTGEMLKVIATMRGPRPIGYDSGFNNFLYREEEDRVYCPDFYPPRLGFA